MQGCGWKSDSRPADLESGEREGVCWTMPNHGITMITVAVEAPPIVRGLGMTSEGHGFVR